MQERQETISPNLSVVPQEPRLPSPCCDCAAPTPSDAARDIGPVAPNEEAIARPILSLTVGCLRSEDRDRLSFRPRRGMAEKVRSQLLPT